MQIKQAALIQQLEKSFAPLYLLIGQDSYLLDNSFNQIKTAIHKAWDVDERVITLQTAEDWQQLIEEANSYSLFAEKVLLNVFYDKKTWGASEKNKVMQYLDNINARCTIIIRAPQLPAKTIQTLSNHPQVMVVLNQPLDAQAMKHWIIAQFNQKSMTFEPQVPEIIQQYTQGNMLACAQLIDKISLSQEAYPIRVEAIRDHLSNQCEHNPFELIDACLLGQADKAVQILRQAALNKTEPTLILWVLTQEIRLLLQLFAAVQNQIDFKTACTQLKIWSQRMTLYQKSLKRHQKAGLSNLLSYCQKIDQNIKSNSNFLVWNALESLALSLSLGQFIGVFV